MHDTNHGAAGPVRLRAYGWLLAAIWTAAFGAALTWEFLDARNHAKEIARGIGRGVFKKDLLFRRWSAGHGGVYVPVTEKTRPNPYLAGLPERDLTTPSGRRLTLMNPACAMRQVNELAAGEDGLKGHVTSLRPIRPANAPDAWESKALKAFELGVPEVSSEETLNGEPHMRLMRPLITEPRCLSCHAEQGYETGDVRGGISVSIPMASVWPVHQRALIHGAAGYGSVWLLGLCGIVLVSRHLRRQIDRRENVEEQLRKTQIRARETAAKLPGVVYQFLWHPDGTYGFPYLSEGVTEMLGLAPEEVYRDPNVFFPGLFRQADVDPILASVVEAVENMATWQREMRVQSVGGEIKWIRATSRPRSMPDGSVLFDGVFVDITDLKEAENKLQQAHDVLEKRVVERTLELELANRELQKEIADHRRAEWWLLQSEERFRSYFELGLVGMAIISPQKEWEEVNQRLCEILGYADLELTGKKWSELTHPEDVEADQVQFNRVLAGTTNGYAMDRRLLRKDGQVVDAHLSMRCLRRPDGTVDCLVALVQDISHRKRTEEELRALSSRYQAILAAVPDVLVEVDARQIITWTNKAGLEFFGEDVLGKDLAYYCQGEEQASDAVQPLFGGGDDVFYLENWQCRKDGQERLLGWWCRTLKDAEGNMTGVLSSGRDLTGRRREPEPRPGRPQPSPIVVEPISGGENPVLPSQSPESVNLSSESSSAFCFADFTPLPGNPSPAPD